jgi:iron(III) transport system ATP-binding protein
MRAVEVNGVTKRFGEIVAVAGVSLHVEEGEAVGLFGPSGSGKTTVLRIVAGLERPDSGCVILRGEPVSGDGVFVAPNERKVGMVFQDLALWPHMSAERHLDFVLKGTSLSREGRKERIDELMRMFELAHRRLAHPGGMSGGEQQRLAIARALATNPSILLLDEPLANLDETLREKVIAELIRLKRESGVSILFTTHVREDLERLADRTVEMGTLTYSL